MVNWVRAHTTEEGMEYMTEEEKTSCHWESHKLAKHGAEGDGAQRETVW